MILSKESIKIIEALQDVKSGQDVYDALNEAPDDNLMDMLDMIDNILMGRGA